MVSIVPSYRKDVYCVVARWQVRAVGFSFICSVPSLVLNVCVRPLTEGVNVNRYLFVIDSKLSPWLQLTTTRYRLVRYVK